MMIFLDKILKYPIILLVGYFATYYFVPLARRFAQRFNIMDIPAKGHIHRRIVARTGGMAIFFGFQVSFLTAVIFFNSSAVGGRIDLNWWSNYFMASLIIFSLGLLDDRYDLRPVIKLLGQIAAAVLMFYFDVNVGKVFGFQLPMLLNLALTLLWFVGIINAFNLIDGLDGLAAGLALIGAVGIATALVFLNKPEDALILLGFIGCCFAFLRFNSNPASIFLGDSGSMFLGFTLAAVSLTVSTKGATFASIGVPLLAVGIPVFDTALAVWRRSTKKLLKVFLGEKKQSSDKSTNTDGLMARDLDHIHHRALRYGLNQKQAAWLLYSASAALVLIGLTAMMFSSRTVGIYLISLIVGVYVVFKHVARTEVITSGKLILAGIQKKSTRELFSMISPVLDFLLLTIALALSITLSSPGKTSDEIIMSSLRHMPIWCSVPLIMEALFGTYSRIWSRARLNNFIALLTILYAGITFSFSLSIIFFNIDTLTHALVVQVLLYMFFSSLFLVGLRSLPLIAQDTISFREDLNDKNKSGILIYGAGTRGELYLMQRNLTAMKDESANPILGFIDNDLSLKNKYVRGYKVLGNINEISEFSKNNKLEKIIITKELAKEELFSLQEFAQNYHVPLIDWRIEEKIMPLKDANNVIYATNRFTLN
ncbi:MAG: hypothetical protein KBC84_11070 [Proteobacteria bacterium]|nr:hypothetical protein [Pseudomonadota bacterium]